MSKQKKERRPSIRLESTQAQKDKWGQAAIKSGADSRVVWIREVLDKEAAKVLSGGGE